MNDGGASVRRVDADDLWEAAVARADRGLRLAVAFGADERGGGSWWPWGWGDRRAGGRGFVARYVFADDRARTFEILEADLDAGAPHFSSVAAVLPAADWYEREMRDLLGIVPVGHPDPRRLVLHEDWPQTAFPLRKDFDPASIPSEVRDPRRPPALVMPEVEGDGVFEVPVGPVHAGIIEPGHFRFSCLGDSILHLEARLFYTHRGAERLAEGKTPDEAMPLVQSVCGVCVVSRAVAFTEAVERAAGVRVPRRIRLVRQFLLELERLYNHVGDISNICAGFGMQVAVQRGLALKERCLRLNDRLVGHRYLRWAVRIGGVAPGVPGDAADLAGAAVEADRIRADLDRLVDLVLGHEGAVDRMEGTGVLPRNVVEALGCVGVAARASGVGRDARRDHPHAAYDEVPPRIVVLDGGDVLARFRIRHEEVRESARLLSDTVRALRGEDARTPSWVSVPPPAAGAWAIAAAESPRGEEVQYVRFGRAGRIDRWKCRSASYANWRAVPHAVPRNIVPDFPLINKSFELCYACTDL